MARGKKYSLFEEEDDEQFEEVVNDAAGLEVDPFTPIPENPYLDDLSPEVDEALSGLNSTGMVSFQPEDEIERPVKPEYAPQGTTTGEYISLGLAGLGDLAGGLRQFTPFGRSQKFQPKNDLPAQSSQVAQQVANRQATADRNYRTGMDEFYKDLNEARIEEDRARAKRLDDPMSPESRNAQNALRTFNIPGLTEEKLREVTAREAEDLKKLGPAALQGLLNRQSAEAKAQRDAQASALTGESLLTAARAAGIDTSNLDVSDPEAVKTFIKLHGDALDRENALERARIRKSGSGGSGNGGAYLPGKPINELSEEEAKVALKQVEDARANPNIKSAERMRLDGLKDELLRQQQAASIDPKYRPTREMTKAEINEARDLSTARAKLKGAADYMRENMLDGAWDSVASAVPGTDAWKKKKRLEQGMTKYMLTQKELDALGAIAGPDMELMKSGMGDVTGFWSVLLGQGEDLLGAAERLGTKDASHRYSQLGLEPRTEEKGGGAKEKASAAIRQLDAEIRELGGKWDLTDEEEKALAKKVSQRKKLVNKYGRPE